MYYSYHSGYYHPRYYQPVYFPARQYPAVDPKILNQSANVSKDLMKDASVVLDKLAESEEFGRELMSAAQQSDSKEVERLIHSLEVTSDVAVYYNPDGLHLEFKSKIAKNQCCTLTIALRWR